MVRAAKNKAVKRAKAERKAKKKTARAEAARLAEKRKRKRKEVKLNNLTSISAGGGDLKSGSPVAAKKVAKKMFSRRRPRN